MSQKSIFDDSSKEPLQVECFHCGLPAKAKINVSWKFFQMDQPLKKLGARRHWSEEKIGAATVVLYENSSPLFFSGQTFFSS